MKRLQPNLSKPKKEPNPRLRMCEVCRAVFQKERMGQRVCSGKCGLESARRKREKIERKDIAIRKENLKTRSDYMKEAQTAFNFYIRTRAIYYGHVCISSGAPLVANGVGGGFDAGHYRSIGSAPHLRFNMNNCWGQSKQDNRYGAGASFEYRRGLSMRRSIEVVEALEADNTVRKFDIPYLIRIRKIFTKKAKRLQKRRE